MFSELLVLTRPVTRNERSCFQVYRQPIPVRDLALEELQDGEIRMGGSFRGVLSNGEKGEQDSRVLCFLIVTGKLKAIAHPSARSCISDIFVSCFFFCSQPRTFSVCVPWIHPTASPTPSRSMTSSTNSNGSTACAVLLIYTRSLIPLTTMSLSVLSDTLQLFLMKFQARTVPSSPSQILVLKPLPQTPLPSNVNCTESAVVVHWGRGRRQECRY